MGAQTDPDYDVGLPDGTADDASGDDTSRTADTSRSTASGAPHGQPPADDPATAGRPDSTSSAGSPKTGAGALVPSGLLRDANRTIRRLQSELARYSESMRSGRSDREPPPRRVEDDLDPESRQIRDQIFKLVPELKALQRFDPEKFDQIVNEFGPRSEGLEKLYWQRNANTHLREVEAQVREVYGEKVDPRAIRRFQAGFIDWIESDPDARERYLDGDPTLVKDYWAETTGLIVEPIRTKAASESVSRAERVSRLPKMPQRGGPIGAARRSEKKPKTEDELHDQAWDALVDRMSAVTR